MTEPTRHVIDDTPTVRPHVRLCHQILREGLGKGYKSIALAAPLVGMPGARGQRGDGWAPLMAFPPAVYDALVGHLRSMAGISDEDGPSGGTILVTLENRLASVAAMTRRDEGGNAELTLLFPAASVAVAT